MTNRSIGAEPPTRLVVGRIAKAHGLRGDVVVAPITNVEHRFATGAELFDRDGNRYEVVAARPHQGRPLVRFAGIVDRNSAEALRGLELLADPIGDAPDGEVWVHDLIGADVTTAEGVELGEVIAVVANPAHDLLELASGRLIPIVFVRDVAAGSITVDLPDGLLDL